VTSSTIIESEGIETGGSTGDGAGDSTVVDVDESATSGESPLVS